jgi:hypothetical protein
MRGLLASEVRAAATTGNPIRQIQVPEGQTNVLLALDAVVAAIAVERGATLYTSDRTSPYGGGDYPVLLDIRPSVVSLREAGAQMPRHASRMAVRRIAKLTSSPLLQSSNMP